jgi:hypothetical protein
MALSANKGEWSEVYAHFKLLADGRLFSGDAKLNKLSNIFFPIIQIMRLEKDNKEYIYKISNDGYNVDILSEESSSQISIPRESFAQMAQTLLEHIITAGVTTFSSEEVEEFMATVNMFKIKAEGKSDIRLMIHNLRTEQFTSLGYSIKSRLGADSTLLNTNRDGTNFMYLINGDLNADQVYLINSIPYINARIDALHKCGCTISYRGVVDPTFRNNLRYLDSDLHRIIAYCLLGYYSHNAASSLVSDVTKFVSFCNPCDYPTNVGMDFYEHKIKQFLINFALGMTANKPWDGIVQANGGYIVVKEDGDIICYHFYDRNQLEDYLFENTYFDTPSTSRHDHGSVMFDNLEDQLYMKLNIQVRFVGREKRKWHPESDYVPFTGFIE